MHRGNSPLPDKHIVAEEREEASVKHLSEMMSIIAIFSELSATFAIYSLFYCISVLSGVAER